MRECNSSTRCVWPHCLRKGVVALVLLLLGLTPGCQSPKHHQSRKEARITVFAAASLRHVFTEIGRRFERDNPGTVVVFNFAGSQELRIQIEHGANATVFATAERRHVDALVSKGIAHDPAIFATNELALVVAKEAADRVTSFAELPNAHCIVVGTPETPIGAYTLRVLDRANGLFGPEFRSRVEARICSREMNVRQVLAKVTLGEAEAGVVYRTDVITADPARTVVVSIPPGANVLAQYPIVRIAGTEHPELAQAWIRAVLSAAGQNELVRAGFSSAHQTESAR
jgi:molybdate transport system substrate-binding protein